jgi:hypothetical protein
VGTTRAIAAPGVRTDAGATGLRGDIGTIARAIRWHPFLLVTGMLGFALRGGIVLLILPILILPTAIEVRFLLGGGLGTSGLTSEFYAAVGLLAVAALGVALLVLYGLARCELASFTRFVNSAQDSHEHAWPAPGRLLEEDQSSVTARLFIVQTLTLLAILVAAIPLAAATGQATLQEVVLPSSTESVYTRILNDVSLPLIFWLVSIVVIEAFSSIATRRVLASAFDLKIHFRILRRPLRAVTVALIGWLLFVGAVAVSYICLSLAWQAVESVFLATGLSGGLREIVSAVLVALMFGAVFAGAMLLTGLVSTVRAGLWTLASLR